MLKGEKVVLRAMTKADLAMRHQFENDTETVLLADDEPPMPVSLEWLEADFERGLQKDRAKDAVWFAIEADGKFIGGCGLFRFNTTSHTCALGICIGDKDYWGRGYGREVIGLLLDYAFRFRNLHKVWLTTGSHNERSRRCYLACGFVEEGRLRAHEWCDGRYIDTIHMGILREEWESRARE